MKIKNAFYVNSFIGQEHCPKDNFPEIAFVGRSNVGKSTLINSLTNRKSLAKTSSQPGKTRLINFYNINDQFYLVDLPGYGYAKVPQKEKERWGKMIEDYLLNREHLKAVIMVVDIRHMPSEDDLLMYRWLEYYKMKTIIVLNKADKLSRSNRLTNCNKIRKALNLKPNDRSIVFSGKTHEGREEILKMIDEIIK
ncbi:MAG TPA: YihA family ribosome biogenesis GTP-binding protein [Thermoanaerobacterales bacterium]|nr:YihA family ribosome biogenesis GTP-binding protein [Thermoanaerobacterales bacterium]